MKIILVAASCFLLLASATPQEPTHAAALEARVRKVWEDFKNKDKGSVSAALADGFRELEEDGNGFGDKTAMLAMIDGYELNSYSLKHFKVRPLGKDYALITYRAHYEGKADGQPIQANTGYGEIWVNQGNDWKLLYVQETNAK